MPRKCRPSTLDAGSMKARSLTHLADIFETATRFREQGPEVLHRLPGLAGDIAWTMERAVKIVPGLAPYREPATGPHHHGKARSQFLLTAIPLVGVEDPEAFVRRHAVPFFNTGDGC